MRILKSSPTPTPIAQRNAAARPTQTQPQPPVAQRRVGQMTPPPVYRPQPLPKVLQLRTANGPRTEPVQTKPRPIAPPVYRPEPNKLVQPTAAKAFALRPPAMERVASARPFGATPTIQMMDDKKKKKTKKKQSKQEKAAQVLEKGIKYGGGDRRQKEKQLDLINRAKEQNVSITNLNIHAGKSKGSRGEGVRGKRVTNEFSRLETEVEKKEKQTTTSTSSPIIVSRKPKKSGSKSDNYYEVLAGIHTNAIIMSKRSEVEPAETFIKMVKERYPDTTESELSEMLRHYFPKYGKKETITTTTTTTPVRRTIYSQVEYQPGSNALLFGVLYRVDSVEEVGEPTTGWLCSVTKL